MEIKGILRLVLYSSVLVFQFLQLTLSARRIQTRQECRKEKMQVWLRWLSGWLNTVFIAVSYTHLSGVIYYGPQSHMGDISQNTNEGIFGTVNQQFKKQLTGEPMEIACRQDVKPGVAYIRSNVSGELEDYEIEIQKVDYNASHKNKSMVIKVTDPRLLELTGGIVQGMSGSPIIQDGKLAGAVTHVFVQDASRGYGILIENMLEH